jgi:phenylacetate-CoA ligase
MKRFIRGYVALSPEKAKVESQKLLHRYLRYCQQYSPYWRERWPKDAETFSLDEAEDVLALLPRLDKTAIREHREALRIRPEYRNRDDGFPVITGQREMRTGGTTGMPVLVYQDASLSHRNRATVDFFYQLDGLTPGDDFFYLWGSNNELSELSTGWRKRLASTLRGLHPLPAFGLTAEIVRAYAKQIREASHIRSAVCFTSSLETFLSDAERQGLELGTLDRVFTGGGLLHDALRRRIQKQLSAEVFDTYGSRDFGLMACETPAHDGRSTAAWMNHLEVLDKRGSRVSSGGQGEIHTTAIWNYSFALIRAATGDTATWHPDPGENQIPTPRITELRGRTAEHLCSPNGTMIDPSAIIHMIGVLIAPTWLRKFQLAQVSPTQFELRVESWEDTLPLGALSDLQRQVEMGLVKLAGASVKVAVVRLASIPPAPSGKHLYCVKCFKS